MKVNGTTVFEGIAIGKLVHFSKRHEKIEKKTIDDSSKEIDRFNSSVAKAKDQLNNLHAEALKKVAEKDAAIFEMHQIMLDDLDFIESVTNMIKGDNVNAEFAVDSVCNILAEEFASMESDYMKARAVDIRDICGRVINVLNGQTQKKSETNDKMIIVADDLMPSETVQLDKSKVVSFVTRFGSTNSHTAIIARSMSMPALIGVDFPEDLDGKIGIVDGFKGILHIDPDQKTLNEYRKLEKEYNEKIKSLKKLLGSKTKTKNGKRIKLFANIAGIKDVKSAIENGAEGIGLYRSELVYMESDHLPTEEEQFQRYKEVVQAMGNKQVIIRTMDIGADKQVPYLDMAKEDNPALGRRAIRICLEEPEMFKTQLRAIIRSSNFGNVGIMYPMIISVEEVVKIKEIVEQVKKELDEEKIPYGDFQQGIMIETPAAALIAEDLAKEVDFFSIGSNDLTQYLLAIDRQNPKLDAFLDTHHDAILKAIKMTVDGGHKHGTWVGLCGELAGDSTIVESLIEMGIDELSVSPSLILPIKNIVVNYSSKK